MKQEYHNLLKKQLDELFNGSSAIPEEMNEFLEHVNDSYIKFEKESQKFHNSHDETEILSSGKVDNDSENLKKEIDERKRVESVLTENLARISKINKYQAIISSITQSVHQSLDLQDVLEYAVDSISKNIDAVMHVTIYFVEGDEAVMQVHRGFTEDYIKRASRIPKGKGLIWKTISTKKAMFVLDTENDDVIGPAGRKMGIKSYISIPLFEEKKPYGAIALTSSEVDGFNEEDFKLAEIVAQQVQTAVDHANKVVQLSVKNRYQSIISSIVKSVYKSIDLQKVLDNAVDAIKQNIEQCSHVSILLIENDNAVMKAFKGYEDKKNFISKVMSIPKPNGFTWKTILDAKTMICNDIEKDKAIGPAGRKTGSKSYICVPLFVNEEVAGTLNLHSKDKNAFNADDVKLLEDAAHQLSVAINNASKAEELNSKNNDLEILTKISEMVHNSLDLGDVYKAALDSIISIDNVDITGVYLVDQTTNEAVIQDHRNFPDAYLEKAASIPEGVGLTWKIINTGDIHHIADVQNDPDLGPAGKKMGWHCVLGIPLVIEKKIEGVIWFISYEIQKYEDHQVELFTSLANQLSISISKARLYQDLSNKSRFENIVSSITQSVHQSIYLDDVFDNAVEALSENIQSVKHAIIYMIEGNYAIMKAHRGFTKKYMDRAGKIPKPKGLVWRTIMDGEARCIADTQYDKAIGEAGVKMGIKSYLSVPIYYDDEIAGVLAVTSSEIDSFKEEELDLLDITCKQIQSAIDNAQKAEALFNSEEYNRLLIENIKDYSIFMLDNDGFVENWNTGAEKLIGFTEKEILGKPFSTFYFPDDNESGLPEKALNIASSENAFEHDVWIVKKDKTSFWANIIINSLRDLDSDLIGYSVAMHDITEKKRAAEELESYAAKLERSNEELEQFAYVASHDLQEPLRMVGSYLGLLERRYKDNIDQDANDFIFYAVDGAKRMQVLINDLLSYSRVSTKGKPFKTVKCSEIMEDVLKNLEVSISESGAEINATEIPDEIVVDKTQISQLLQNLIGNALKFCKNRKPEILIRAQDKDSFWEFSVSDNGIGIEPEYFDRIFVIFQRLHGKTEYAGTGIGLALCKKIVFRHGGDIWVESKPGEGSNFYFTIPKRRGIYENEK